MAPSRYIPKDSYVFEHPDGLGVVYIYRLGEKLCGIAYGGKRSKADWHYRLGNAERADQKITEYFDSLSGHVKLRDEYKQKRNTPHTLKVGDIIYNSWGYDQTNIDYYEIVKTSEHFVWLRELCQEITNDSGCGPMSGRVVPVPGKYANAEVIRHHATNYGGSGDTVTFKFGSGSKWDGQARYCSWYA